MRLLSDSNFARDATTACTFQSFVNNQAKMESAFAAAFGKLALTAQTAHATIGECENDTNSFKCSCFTADCSEAVPPQAPPVTKKAT